jgi:3-hydroxyisobutyrate dehydrogenase
MIAFFGMGLLGSGFVRALRRRGEEVHVYNRTYARAQALTAHGARPFREAHEAARDAARIHLTLSDDAAVDDVLEQASAGFAPNVLIVDHTTTSVHGAKARVERWAERGVRYLHAPVFMGPQNALNATGVMLASGDQALIESIKPALEAMTGTLWNLGPQADRAAAFKLLGNSFLMFLTSGLSDMLSLAKATGIEPHDAVTLFDKFNPGSTIGARAKRMIEGAYDDPSWELAMARKDVRLMIEQAQRANVPLAVLPAIAARMDEVIAEGHAHHDWTVIAHDALGR